MSLLARAQQGGYQDSRVRKTFTPQQLEITDAFRSECYVRDPYDVQHGHLWDSLTFDAGQVFESGQELFSIPQGQVDQLTGKRKTYADTSMNMPYQLMNPEAFAIRRLLFTFNDGTLQTDMYAIAEGLMWRFWMGRKTYLASPIISLQQVSPPKAPIRICEYCKAVYVNALTCPGCGAREFSLSSLGECEAGKAFALDLGKHAEIVIEQGIHFCVTFEGESHRLSAPLKMWSHFEGLHARGIQ